MRMLSLGSAAAAINRGPARRRAREWLGTTQSYDPIIHLGPSRRARALGNAAVRGNAARKKANIIYFVARATDDMRSLRQW
jgi:hypothetical protein